MARKLTLGTQPVAEGVRIDTTQLQAASPASMNWQCSCHDGLSSRRCLFNDHPRVDAMPMAGLGFLGRGPEKSKPPDKVQLGAE
jgi:hypothetical protein